MILHSDPLLSIYFGDARTSLEREVCMSDCSQEDLWNQGTLRAVKKLMHLNNLLFLKQMHSDRGVLVATDTLEHLAISKKEGDYLITQLGSIGLGVYTADCLPIVFYDSFNHAIGICHAGWLGSVQGIALKAVQAMEHQFGTRLEHLRVFFGPSAKVCCYKVTAEFSEQVGSLEYAHKILIHHGRELFFDLPLYNQLRLDSYGIKRESFHCTYNICTICHTSFCSNRRQGAKAARQLTIVALK